MDNDQPAAARLTAAGPLRDTDTIQVTRDGHSVPIQLKVLAAYLFALSKRRP